jgi:hypothetical protein
MPIKKAKKFDIAAIIGASVAGAGTSIAIDMLDDKVKQFETRPWASPAIMQGLGLAVLYFGTNDTKAVGYGILGAASADLGGQLLEKIQGGESAGTSSVGKSANNRITQRIKSIERVRDMGMKSGVEIEPVIEATDLQKDIAGIDAAVEGSEMDQFIPMESSDGMSQQEY